MRVLVVEDDPDLGRQLSDALTQAGYAVMTVGNREFHVTRYGFRCKLSCAGFPVLCANVRPSRTKNHPLEEKSFSLTNNIERELPVCPSLLHVSPSGWRIAIFGLTVPMVTERMLSRAVSAYLFTDPIATAADLVSRIREEFSPDIVVALTHIGLKQDRRLAESVAGIDLILGGHSHDVLEHGERIGETLICQTGCYAQYLGRVEVERREDGRLVMNASLETL
jgi:2',3'-cyclic-nucleotide 2'-phosphodiesterase (5'-nucleotidase family)